MLGEMDIIAASDETHQERSSREREDALNHAIPPKAENHRKSGPVAKDHPSAQPKRRRNDHIGFGGRVTLPPTAGATTLPSRSRISTGKVPPAAAQHTPRRIRMDPDCAICQAPAAAMCDCESQDLEEAVKLAEKKTMTSRYDNIRSWAMSHAQEYMLNYFDQLVDVRKTSYFEHLDRITTASFTNAAMPLEMSCAHAQAALMRGINEDWQVVFQQYPVVLEHFYSLVELNLPTDGAPAVKHPRLNLQRPAKKKRMSESTGRNADSRSPPLTPRSVASTHFSDASTLWGASSLASTSSFSESYKRRPSTQNGEPTRPHGREIACRKSGLREELGPRYNVSPHLAEIKIAPVSLPKQCRAAERAISPDFIARDSDGASPNPSDRAVAAESAKDVLSWMSGCTVEPEASSTFRQSLCRQSSPHSTSPRAGISTPHLIKPMMVSQRCLARRTSTLEPWYDSTRPGPAPRPQNTETEAIFTHYQEGASKTDYEADDEAGQNGSMPQPGQPSGNTMSLQAQDMSIDDVDNESSDCGFSWSSDSSNHAPKLDDSHPLLALRSQYLQIIMTAFDGASSSSRCSIPNCNTAHDRGDAMKNGSSRKHSRSSDSASDTGERVRNTSKSKRRAVAHQLCFACPFAKKDPVRHRDCYRYFLTRIRDVKQHLKRCHRMPIHCARCSETFVDEDDRDEHLRSADCAVRPLRRIEGISERQQTQLSQRVSSRMAEDEQWFTVFDIIFPDHPHPRSPWFQPSWP